MSRCQLRSPKETTHLSRQAARRRKQGMRGDVVSGLSMMSCGGLSPSKEPQDVAPSAVGTPKRDTTLDCTLDSRNAKVNRSRLLPTSRQDNRPKSRRADIALCLPTAHSKPNIAHLFSRLRGDLNRLHLRDVSRRQRPSLHTASVSAVNNELPCGHDRSRRSPIPNDHSAHPADSEYDAG